MVRGRLIRAAPYKVLPAARAGEGRCGFSLICWDWRHYGHPIPTDQGKPLIITAPGAHRRLLCLVRSTTAPSPGLPTRSSASPPEYRPQATRHRPARMARPRATPPAPRCAFDLSPRTACCQGSCHQVQASALCLVREAFVGFLRIFRGIRDEPGHVRPALIRFREDARRGQVTAGPRGSRMGRGACHRLGAGAGREDPDVADCLADRRGGGRARAHVSPVAARAESQQASADGPATSGLGTSSGVAGRATPGGCGRRQSARRRVCNSAASRMWAREGKT
ncbi:hypothetical protein Aros01_07263 [Streptosporangium roseum]|uniref:Uncharacterized protein n=1 Tax=Streptosporangium roseum (strain ATCC 12428 / DSM 43021 / JCM 3005 / KCTC 9067 / NCIMB 10171 / NRRL 2505 / NI 9100) TaxID=479432 RepID=D2B7D3_STRRD|nr:hypothetical protein Sros_6957 [Streptosporangium roseum DSM 43021]